MPIALLALTLSAFAIGTTEFVIVGLIPTMAADLNVSLPSAGLLVSLYALGVAIGAPVLTALTSKMNRKHVLLAVMGLFVVGNLLAWQAPGYNTLIAARILTGLGSRRVLLYRLDDRHWLGIQRKSRQCHCNYVHWSNRCSSDWRASWYLYRATFWLGNHILNCGHSWFDCLSR